jgi:hypothetical protein
VATSAIQSHRRRDAVCELFVDANLFFFQGPAGISVRINLPSREALTAGLNSRAQVPIGCPESGFGCILRLGAEQERQAASQET